MRLSTPLHLLLKTYPCVEGDVADGKAYPSVCHQLGQVYVLQFFQPKITIKNIMAILELLQFELYKYNPY